MEKQKQLVLGVLGEGAEARESKDGQLVRFSVPRPNGIAGEIRWPLDLLLDRDEARVRAVAMAIHKAAQQAPDHFVAAVRVVAGDLTWNQL